MSADPLPWIDGHGRRFAEGWDWDGHCPGCRTVYSPRLPEELAVTPALRR
jgi:hypothetical protein